jgi:hypothetical protein
MRSRDRLWVLLAPLLIRPAQAQPTSSTSPAGPARQSKGEVQVGAGTQGDVTTGSSGSKAKPDAARKGDADASGADKGGPRKGDATAQATSTARKDRK